MRVTLLRTDYGIRIGGLTLRRGAPAEGGIAPRGSSSYDGSYVSREGYKGPGTWADAEKAVSSVARWRSVALADTWEDEGSAANFGEMRALEMRGRESGRAGQDNGGRSRYSSAGRGEESAGWGVGEGDSQAGRAGRCSAVRARSGSNNWPASEHTYETSRFWVRGR